MQRTTGSTRVRNSKQVSNYRSNYGQQQGRNQDDMSDIISGTFGRQSKEDMSRCQEDMQALGSDEDEALSGGILQLQETTGAMHLLGLEHVKENVENQRY